MTTRNRRTRPVLAVAAVAMAILTTTHQASAAELTHVEMVEVSNDKSVFNVSVFPGKAGYDNGTVSGIFGDGTVLDYRFFNNDGSTFNGAGYADGGAGLCSVATATDPTGSPHDWADVWTVSDPDTDAADFTDDTIARAQISGTIDISRLQSGTLYFIYGSYRESNTIALTMSGPGQPDILADHTEDPPNTVNRAWVLSFDFSDASAYETISYSYTNAVERRARFMGVIVDGAITDPQNASDPSPDDGATDVCRSVSLSWTPGVFAAPVNGHKVYFGESFDDVNDATGGVAQTATSYTPSQRLDFGTTYYWRVDEVNAPPTSHIEYKGNVWSFTTEPVGYPIDGSNITATASSSDAGQGPENTVNRSGLDANDMHSIEMTDMWLSNAADANAAWIQYEFDKIYKLHQMWVWNHNTPFEVWTGFGFKDVTIEYSTNGTNWTELAGVPPFARGTGSPDYTHNAPVDLHGMVAKYVKITANSNWSGGPTTQYGLSEVRFFYIPVWAREPEPASGATDVALDDVVLSWRAGREAAEHNVYVSTKRQAVINGTAPVTNIPAAGECLASHDAGALELGKTYYWKINEVNTAETPTSWEGDVWSFATPEYFVVEDFEDYNDYPPNRVFETWKGGYGYSETEFGPRYCGNGTGSAVGHATEPYAEQTIVHEGNQSMPFYYDNSGTGQNSCGQPINLYYSETERTFDTPQDWTKAGVRALTLYFYGDPDNDAGATEQMYVKVNGAKVVYDGDMADIKQASWHEWNIDLASFAGVNLQNVTKISIGLGNGTGPGGSGVLYFDDIRLYPSRCVPDRKEPPAADLNNDCVVDYLDLDVVVKQWLTSGYLVTPVQPGTANLVGHWKFDETSGLTAADTSGSGNNGTLIGMTGTEWTTGVMDGALGFDGTDDYVDISNPASFNFETDFTWTAWIKTTNDGTIIAVAPATGDWAQGGKTMFVRGGTLGVDIGWVGAHASPIAINDGAWHHVAATTVFETSGDNDTTTLYVDGQPDAVRSNWNVNMHPESAMTNKAVKIGFTNGNFPANPWFNGLIDEVRVYNSALTVEGIAYLAGMTEPFSEPFDLNVDGMIDFKDFAELAVWWLDEELWPQP